MEFVADLYPDSGLLPSDPVGRAKARFFVDVVNTKFANPYVAYLHGEGTTMASLLPGLEAIQALLPADQSLALGGDFTIADAAVAPFLLHMAAVLKVRDTEGVGATLRSERFARLAKYVQTLKEHPSVKSAWDEVCPPFLLLGRAIANISLLDIHHGVFGQSPGLALVEELGEGGTPYVVVSTN
jgi:glutathione S-transferase